MKQTIRIKIQVFNSENLTHFDSYYEKEIEHLNKALDVTQDIVYFLIRILKFVQI